MSHHGDKGGWVGGRPEIHLPNQGPDLNSVPKAARQALLAYGSDHSHLRDPRDSGVTSRVPGIFGVDP